VIAVEAVGWSVPEYVLDSAVRASVEDMLLRRVVSQKRCRVGDGGGRASAAGPIIVIEAISRSVIEDMMDRVIRSAVEDVLLVGTYGHQSGGIAGGGRSAGERRPVVVIEAIGGRIPEDVLNC